MPSISTAANAVMAGTRSVGYFASGRKISEPGEAREAPEAAVHSPPLGRKSVEIYYTLVKTKSGHLIELAHCNFGGATGNVADADTPS